MSEKQTTWAKYSLTVLVVLLLGFFGMRYPLPAQPDDIETLATSSTRFRSVQIDHDLNVDGATTLDEITSAGAFTISSGDLTLTTGDLTITAGDIAATAGSLTVGADVTVDDTLNIDDTDSVIVGTQTITPSASYYQMSPVTALTLTLATGEASEGDLLIVHSMVSTNTIIIDTGATVGGSNITLSTNDLAMFIFGNGKWVEIASPDNS